ncbi:hypothetical protein [Clostridium sp.]|uniref:hypothetical protein n=1 Tax=Clostridium sp. TaxID=1506 RepID=UPI0026037007|nr:hypothetical protein [Clostridium sp.]
MADIEFLFNRLLEIKNNPNDFNDEDLLEVLEIIIQHSISNHRNVNKQLIKYFRELRKNNHHCPECGSDLECKNTILNSNVEAYGTTYDEYGTYLHCPICNWRDEE